jgi:hypothetical protein
MRDKISDETELREYMPSSTPFTVFTPHKMNHDELLRNMKDLTARPGMYGADWFVACLVANALETIEDMTP